MIKNNEIKLTTIQYLYIGVGFLFLAASALFYFSKKLPNTKTDESFEPATKAKNILIVLTAIIAICFGLIFNTYTTPENISSSGAPGADNLVGQLKIRLDGVVPTTVNKDFFLVRRPKVSANNLLLDYPFPYGVLASASISEGLVVGTGSFALTGSGALNNPNADGYTGSFSELEIATTPGILYPSFPTEYLVQSASIIVNELVSKGIIES